MRASIACLRCRRSKVRCINDGADTPCRACQASNRQCTYSRSSPGPQRSHKRAKSGDLLDDSIDGDDTPRQRKRASSRDSLKDVSVKGTRGTTAALEARVLTPSVWLELYDIFQLHYSADFPFLHATTFTKPLRQAQVASDNADSVSFRPPGSDGFLLAFLALTARYHPGLITAHNRRIRDADPLSASRYYATAAVERLTDVWRTGWGDLDDVQGLLMLGLHEFGMCKGRLGWTLIGLATKAAQAMGLQHQADLDDAPPSRSRSFETVATSASSPSTSEDGREQDRFLRQEICRRTFWSCFIMDRYVSSGKYCPQMLLVNDLRIQLPASERSFAFAERVQTPMLHESEAEFVHRLKQSSSVSGGKAAAVKTETGSAEGLASKYIRMVALFGRVAKWSCAGGRRIEKLPPWDQRSEFHELHRSCLDFKAALPRDQVLSAQNTQTHISMKTSTPYVLMHVMYSLCQVMLHREYVPFIPIGCTHPVGPLDPPLFPRDKFDVPPGFWEDRAEECFKSARDIIDLVKTCQEWNAMVETPFMGFALYITGFVAVYCDAFPWMDQGRHMCNGKDAPKHMIHEAGQRAQDIVLRLSSKLRMANGWSQALRRMRRHFAQKNAEYRDHLRTISTANMPYMKRPRQNGYGGGLEEYKQMEHMLEFGQLSDGDPPLLELVTSRESTYQAEEAMTPAASDMINNRYERRVEGNSTDGRSAASLDDDSAEHSGTLRGHYNQRSNSGVIEQQSNTFRVPQVPHERTAESTSTSPTVYTPSSMSTQPSPGSLYNQAAYSGWPPYQQVSQYANAGIPVPLQQSALMTGAPSYGTYPGPVAVSDQYVAAHLPMAGVPNTQIWPVTPAKDRIYHLPDLGLPAEDFIAYLHGENVADHAARAAGTGPTSWLATLWKPENDP